MIPHSIFEEFIRLAVRIFLARLFQLVQRNWSFKILRFPNTLLPKMIRHLKNVCIEVAGDLYDVNSAKRNWLKLRVKEHGVICVLVVERQGALDDVGDI